MLLLLLGLRLRVGTTIFITNILQIDVPSKYYNFYYKYLTN
jgi:hypothetical protein